MALETINHRVWGLVVTLVALCAVTERRIRHLSSDMGRERGGRGRMKAEMTAIADLASVLPEEAL